MEFWGFGLMREIRVPFGVFEGGAVIRHGVLVREPRWAWGAIRVRELPWNKRRRPEK